MAGEAHRAARLERHKVKASLPRHRKTQSTAVKREPTKRERSFDLSDEEIERRLEAALKDIRSKRR